MHKSLTFKSNLLLISIWIVVIIVFLFGYSYPSNALMLGVGACLGLIAGIFQYLAIQQNKALFLVATTVKEVRSAMTASKAGRFAIYTLWFASAAVLLTAIYQREAVFFGFIGGYAAFAFVRDSIALIACLSLQSAFTQNKESNR